MKNRIIKKSISMILVMVTLFSVCSFASFNAEAATKSGGYVINVYDSSPYYSGRYEIDKTFSFGDIGFFGKSVKIEFINFCSGLTKEQENFYKKYARFNVYVCCGDYVQSFQIKKVGESFKIPQGKNMKVWIHSRIDSTGWNEFERLMRKGMAWDFGQYRLKY